MKQAFIFDVFGTLVDWRTGVAHQVRNDLETRGLKVDPFAFADHWRSLYGSAMERVRSGRRGYVPLDVLHRENLDETLAVFGIGADFDDGARETLNHAWEHLPAWPDVGPGMDRLRTLGFLAPCSNASVALSVRLARFAGLTWDAIGGADVAQDYKPKQEVYLATARALGLAPGQVVMVAAHNGDLAAAREAGLRTAFFPRATEHGPGQESDLIAESDWDYVANDLIDLATRIERSA